MYQYNFIVSMEMLDLNGNGESHVSLKLNAISSSDPAGGRCPRERGGCRVQHATAREMLRGDEPAVGDGVYTDAAQQKRQSPHQEQQGSDTFDISLAQSSTVLYHFKSIVNKYSMVLH